MAIGRKTDPIRVATIKAMAELGFEAGLIAELLKLARQTVADIVKGRGCWAQVDPEVVLLAKHRVEEAISGSAYELAMMAMNRLEEKIKTASIWESIAIMEALSRAGGLIDGERQGK